MALFDFKDLWIIIKYHQELTYFEASLQNIAKEECLNRYHIIKKNLKVWHIPMLPSICYTTFR